jgi:hypothetical protein
MNYTLQDFCADIHAILKEENNSAGREKVRKQMEKLLENDTFIEQFCGPDKKAGVYKLNEDPTTGAVVLAHVMDDAHVSPPHDHGASWAVYGQAAGQTTMREYDRTDDGAEESFTLEKTKEYTLNKGEVSMFDVGAIHSIDYTDGARFVRVTGVDLDRIERHAFDTKRGIVKTIRSEGVSVD